MCWHPRLLLFSTMASGYNSPFLYTQISSRFGLWIISWTQRHMWKNLGLGQFSIGQGAFCFSHYLKMSCHWVDSMTAVQHSSQELYMESPAGVPERKWGKHLLPDALLGSFYNAPISEAPHNLWKTQNSPISSSVSSTSFWDPLWSLAVVSVCYLLAVL